MDELDRIKDRGYCVKENVLVYYTEDMDKSLQWFERVLGWSGRIIDRNEEGAGVYGFTSDMPEALVVSQAVPFKGVHMWHGEPVRRTIALIGVRNIDALHKFVRHSGWREVSDIYASGASPKTLDVTTPDGSVLMFFEQ